MGIKIISKNRKAFHNFNISDRIEAGIELVGTEVKSLRAAKVNLGDGWVDITDQKEAWLKEVHIGQYDFGNRANHQERRERRLLLHKREIQKLNRAIAEKGFSVVPTAIYFKGRHIKVEIGLGKGKKSFDKRQSSKQRDANRDMARAMKR